MRAYLKSRVGDLILSLCLTVSLVYTIASGFVLEPVWSGRPYTIVLLSLIVLFVLFLAAYRRILTLICIGVGCGGAVLTVLYMQASHPLAEEAANSVFLYLLITVLTAVLVFLLGRSRAGIIVLFLTGNLIGAGAHFLQFPAPLWSFLLFTFAAFALFFHRVYLAGLKRAALGRVRPGRHLVQGTALCLAALGLAGGLYAGVIRPLNPPTQELKLITLLKSMDTLKVLGVSTVKTVLDPEQTSFQPPEQTQHSNEEGEEPEDVPEETPLSTPPEESLPAPEEITGNTKEELSAVSYDRKEWNPLWLLLLIPLAIAGACVLRLVLRRRWQAKVQALPREDGVVNYYQFFTKRLGRIGLARPEGHTLRKFAEDTAHQLESFAVGEATFAALTEIYEGVLYGCRSVTREEYRLFEEFYRHFAPALRRELGPVKYYLRIFQF